ncbi:aryl-alcohol dehydrogenase-like predicted oxidoreductase [Hypnocyclicus thermotrophus]|uniref:Aryl-alcohol dehydrogenase-like predicted oxidoreductase n=1 Tax=Hypnocyclicus thermotrophus TaxID=1627895 RepID=A0AA46I585_9FUSO|nr:aldo/keto reductase [Hypnocyclicus thermotrophus]TDT69181.1 aryl-alcohol dehydrogenase-like predicted oxidoreductase [Hypnocyclicus thermotrophus]
MKYNLLGNSDLNVSKIGFGCWATSKHGWKDVNLNDAIKTLETSFEYGINFFDTAPIYGFGKSEEILGQVFNSVRNKIIIATKFGLRWNEFGKVIHDLSRDSIMYEIEASLKRLRTNYIDLYQIHWPDNKTDILEVINTLEELKSQKIIKHIGVSNLNIDDLKKISSFIVSTQNKYNLLEKNVESNILPFCNKKNIGFIAYSPLAQGLLSGKIDSSYKFSKNDIRRFNPLFKDKELFNKIDKINKPLINSALKFLLEKKDVSSILISMTKLNHLKENIKIAESI